MLLTNSKADKYGAHEGHSFVWVHQHIEHYKKSLCGFSFTHTNKLIRLNYIVFTTLHSKQQNITLWLSLTCINMWMRLNYIMFIRWSGELWYAAGERVYNACRGKGSTCWSRDQATVPMAMWTQFVEHNLCANCCLLVLASTCIVHIERDLKVYTLVWRCMFYYKFVTCPC